MAAWSSARLTALNNVQALFTPDSGSASATAGDIGSDITGFFDSFSSLEANPTDNALRQQVLSSASTLAGDVSNAAASLNQQRAALDQNASGITSQVNSLTGLVGQAPLPTVQNATGPPQTKVQAVVMGDSTAAGLGNPLVAHPSTVSRACRRSADAYAADLAAVNDWNVLNLACSGATIAAGLLGPQQAGGVTVPAQLSEARKATHAQLVIVSIGANDVGWSGLVGLCAAAKSCADSASTAYFQQHLATFTSQYYQLLEQLATLPSHPRVLINLYYNPFDAREQCLTAEGLDATKENALTELLSALNKVLSNGAAAASQIPVQPDFTGHALCDPGPYVQGIGDPAPFHPTAAGELAIALADEQALQQAETAPGSTPASLSPAPGATPSPGFPAPGTSASPAAPRSSP